LDAWGFLYDVGSGISPDSQPTIYRYD